jgi:hypothetical protein
MSTYQAVNPRQAAQIEKPEAQIETPEARRALA